MICIIPSVVASCQRATSRGRWVNHLLRGSCWFDVCSWESRSSFPRHWEQVRVLTAGSTRHPGKENLLMHSEDWLDIFWRFGRISGPLVHQGNILIITGREGEKICVYIFFQKVTPLVQPHSLPLFFFYQENCATKHVHTGVTWSYSIFEAKERKRKLWKWIKRITW